MEDVHSNHTAIGMEHEDEEQDDDFQKTAEEAVLEGVDTTNVDELLQKAFFGFTPGKMTRESLQPVFIHFIRQAQDFYQEKGTRTKEDPARHQEVWVATTAIQYNL